MDFRRCSCGCAGELHEVEFARDAPLPVLVRPVPTGPVVEPLELDVVKTHLRVSGTSEDTLIGLYLSSARRSIEAACERSIAVQDLEALVGLVGGTTWPIELPWGPVQEVLSVESVPVEGARVPITGWSLTGNVLTAPAEGWPPAPAAVAVTYTAGTEAADPPLLHAILLLVGEAYDHRSAVVTGTIVAVLPFAVEYLIAPYRQTTGLGVL